MLGLHLHVILEQCSHFGRMGLTPSRFLRNVLWAHNFLLLSNIMTVNTSLYLSSCIVDILGIHCWQHIICLLRALVIFQFHYLFCMEENPWNQHPGIIPLLPWIRSVWEGVSIVSTLGWEWKKGKYISQAPPELNLYHIFLSLWKLPECQLFLHLTRGNTHHSCKIREK